MSRSALPLLSRRVGSKYVLLMSIAWFSFPQSPVPRSITSTSPYLDRKRLDFSISRNAWAEVDVTKTLTRIGWMSACNGSSRSWNLAMEAVLFLHRGSFSCCPLNRQPFASMFRFAGYSSGLNFTLKQILFHAQRLLTELTWHNRPYGAATRCV